MLGMLRRPRWAVFTVLAVVLSGLFVRLGLWQLDRYRERIAQNTLLESRLDLPPVAAEDALGEPLENLEYRPVVAVGRFRPDEEVLLRGQVWRGEPGFHVVTPFELSSGAGVVLVDRGWIPLDFDRVPVTQAPPPVGTVEISGLLRLPRVRGRGSFQGSMISRVDPALLTEVVEGRLLPFWIEMVAEPGRQELPIPSDLPDFTDTGPHLGYAFQWFAFALITVIGYGFLLRKAASST